MNFNLNQKHTITSNLRGAGTLNDVRGGIVGAAIRKLDEGTNRSPIGSTYSDGFSGG